MKKLLSLLLILTLTASLCACTGNSNKTNVTKVTAKSKIDIEVLSCAFDNAIMGIDEEFLNWGFTEREGKVYINLSLRITNNSKENLTKDDFKGSFEFNESKYDLQYSLASVAPKNDDENILPGCVGMVNMLALVDESAMDSDITVNYSIKGEEFSEKVSPLDTQDAFSKKTEVKSGDKFSVHGLYDVEVVSCKEKEYLSATQSKNGDRYLPGTGKKFVDLVVKIKNNTDVELDPVNILNYIILENGEAARGNVRFEANDNTELGYDKLQPQTKEIAHFFVSVEDNVKTHGLAMRFNLAGNCYYMIVE